jgi:magnesium-transporting ATPase (P-type)
MAAALVPVLGVDIFLEARSSAALAKLTDALRPLARVIRDGAVRTVPTEMVVPGDLLALEEGDVVHADGAVREAANLALDESWLTGESEPQAKRACLAPRTAAPGTDANEATQQVFAGSLVLAGKGLVEVVSTGAKTRFGHIAQLIVAAGSTKLRSEPCFGSKAGDRLNSAFYRSSMNRRTAPLGRSRPHSACVTGSVPSQGALRITELVPPTRLLGTS